MRMVPLAFAAALLAAAAAAAPCSFNGHDLSGIPSAKFQMPQNVPSNPGLNADKEWYVSLCSPTTVTTCGDHNNGYVVEAEPGSVTCSVGFNTANPNGWIEQYGGAHTDYTGQYQQPNDRVMNLTLVCDPAANTLQPDVNYVLAHPSQSNPNVWYFDMRLKSSAICGGGPGPGPGPNPGPPGAPGAPEKKDEGASAGAIIFVVLVFVCPLIYVGAFMAYNKFKLGKEGIKELLPHPEFWKDFPYLCLDGCKFVKNKFMKLIGKGDGSGEYGPYGGDGSYTKV